MRIVVYGVGAIGGVLAVALSRAGQEVIGIARGRQLEAIRKNGLVMRTPDGDRRADLATVSDPTEIQFRDDDIVILAMKTQDTPAAVERLRVAGISTQSIFCAQNGVANDDMALRLFPTSSASWWKFPPTTSPPAK
jgi:2-dehydropantoate 2-reductase